MPLSCLHLFLITVALNPHVPHSIFSSKGDAAAASVWTQQAHTLNETHARTLMLRSVGGRLSHRAAQQGAKRIECNNLHASWSLS